MPIIAYIVIMDIKSIGAGGRKRRPFEERFWEKVKKGGPDDCWEWTGATHPFGYGRLTAGRGVNLKAHRVAYALANGGTLPDGSVICHRCDNPPCCNPAHLFLGTKKDNTHDMMSKGRMKAPPNYFGERHHATKFDAATAKKIATDSRPMRVVAAEYGISSMTVFRLRHGLTWKELK